jgi:general secretion pathway protein E
MAQRLMRVICPDCKKPYRLQEGTTMAEELRRLGVEDPTLHRGEGCDKCLQTGYLGRTGIFELMLIDDEIKELTTQKRGSHVIKQAAIRKGMTTLREDGLRKALAGVTTIEEVYRVTQDVAQTGTEVMPDAGH